MSAESGGSPPNETPGERTSEFLDSLRSVDELTEESLREFQRPLFGPQGSLQELFEQYGGQIEFNHRGRPNLQKLVFSVLSPDEHAVDAFIAQKLFRGQIIYNEEWAGYEVSLIRHTEYGVLAFMVHDTHEDSHINYRLGPDGRQIILAVKTNGKIGESPAKAQAQLYVKRFADFLVGYEPPEFYTGTI